MSAPFIVPFNFQPVSTTIKTASFTVPAGKYGLIKMLVFTLVDTTYTLAANTSGTKTVTEDECMLFINGVSAIAYPYAISSVVNISSNGTLRSATIQMPASYGLCQIAIRQVASTTGTPSGSCAIQYNTTTIVTAALNTGAAGIGNCTLNSYQNGSSSTFSSTVTQAFSPLNYSQSDAWVKSGDVITIPTGGKFIFTEYNMIS